MNDNTGRDDARAVLDARRVEYIDETIAPRVEQLFAEEPWLRSVALLTGQFWNDEAVDAVNVRVVCSQLERPNLGANFTLDAEDADTVNLPGDIIRSGGFGRDWQNSWWGRVWRISSQWDNNGAAIPLFAAYCSEHGSQDADADENYRPVVLWQRDGIGNLTRTFVGVQLRPWLDGLDPSEEY